MARTKDYQHFCAAARTLEVIGEKWSLLIVRDLLRGPQRYTDLLRCLRNITPKWLTLRLRDLEEAGVVASDRQEGRREVWYRLTDKGRELAPVLKTLAAWGVKNAMRPPLPGEAVQPEHVIPVLTAFLNNQESKPSERVAWIFRFVASETYTIRFDGELWVHKLGKEQADICVETTPEDMARLITAGPEESRTLIDRLNIEGETARVDEFFAAFGVVATHAGKLGRYAEQPD